MIVKNLIAALREDDTVYVNDLGLFRKVFTRAHVEEKQVFPPRYSVLLDSEEEGSGYAFILFVSKTENIRIVDADLAIRRWVEQLTEELHKGRNVTVEGFGTFSMKKNKLEFTAAPEIPELNVEFEGMEPIDIQKYPKQKHPERTEVLPPFELEPEPVIEPGPVVEPEPVVESEPIVEPEAIVETDGRDAKFCVSTTGSETGQEPESETTAESETAIEDVRTTEDKPENEDEAVDISNPEPIAEPEPIVEPEPVVEPKPVIEPEPVVEPEYNDAAESRVEPEPVVEPETVVEPDGRDAKFCVSTTESETEQEPESETASESEQEIEEEPTTEEKPENEEEAEEEESDEKPEPKKRWGWVVFIVVLLLAIGVLGWFFKDNLLDFYHQKFDKQPVVDDTTAVVATPVEEPVIMDTLVDSDSLYMSDGEYVEPESEAKPFDINNLEHIQYEKGKFYLVHGSFSQEADCARHIRSHHFETYAPTILHQSGNARMRVCLGVFNSEEESSQFASTNGIKDAWTLK